MTVWGGWRKGDQGEGFTIARHSVSCSPSCLCVWGGEMTAFGHSSAQQLLVLSFSQSRNMDVWIGVEGCVFVDGGASHQAMYATLK